MGLWVVLWWNRCGEPSQALRASSPGGRAKSLVGIGRQSDKSRFVELFEVCTRFLALRLGEARVRWAWVDGGRRRNFGVGKEIFLTKGEKSSILLL